LSYEGLSGAVFGRGLAGSAVIDRLHDVAPDARVLLVLRRQQEMVPSLYRQYVQQGGTRPYHPFARGDELPGCRFDPKHLEFDRLVARYEQCFPGRVWVVPYELMRADRVAFGRALAEWIGVDDVVLEAASGARNVSLSWPLVWLLRRWNRLFRRSRFNERPLIALRPTPRALFQRRIDPLVRRVFPRSGDIDGHGLTDEVLATYGASNRRLEEMRGLDLGVLGYPT
jgi:hypothetical protein